MGVHSILLPSNLLNMAAMSYATIKSLSADLKSFLTTHKLNLPFDVDETSMVVLVDIQNDLGDIMAANPAKLALVLALENDRPTICVLGADSNGDILADHVNGNLDGQERWPDADQIRYSENTAYSSFFV
jgi:hypothetical protein